MSDSRVRTLADEQLQRLLDLPGQVRAETSLARRWGQLVGYVGAVLGANAALLTRRDGRWAVLAESTSPPGSLPPPFDPAWRALAAGHGWQSGIAVWEANRSTWTLVEVRTDSELDVVLALEGDWTPSTSGLRQVAASASAAWPVPAGHAQLAVASHRLARELSRVSGERVVASLMLRHVVRALPSRIGVLAVPDEHGQLVVLATHGYPLALVEHLRIPSGVGVLGSVYQRRAPLRVSDVTQHPTLWKRRSRYRSKSFVAVPLVGGSEVLGVIALTDRDEGGVFTRDDLKFLRALVAPGVLALARERQRQHAERHALSAAIDAVSGLYNRRYFERRLDEELKRARRSQLPVALLMLDIDDFKAINDTFGHQAGDAVIGDVAEILRTSVRAFDVCTRYGGEEFAVLMPGNGPESAATTAERIRQRIENHRVQDHRYALVRVTASIGIAVAQDGERHELIERADRALYVAKRAGKNQVRVETV